MSYIQTSRGKKFDLLNYLPSDILIEDIAHALGNLCRFSGHIPQFYSVSQHCVEMSWIAPPGLEMDTLMHDASEAYLGDMTKHLKEILPDYKAMEANMTSSIALRFGLIDPMPAAIKKLDGDMLETEFAQVWKMSFDGRPKYGDLLPVILRPMPPALSGELFLQRFRQLDHMRGITHPR